MNRKARLPTSWLVFLALAIIGFAILLLIAANANVWQDNEPWMQLKGT